MMIFVGEMYSDIDQDFISILQRICFNTIRTFQQIQRQRDQQMQRSYDGHSHDEQQLLRQVLQIVEKQLTTYPLVVQEQPHELVPP